MLVHINDWSTSPSKIVAKRRDPTRAKGSLEAKNLSPDIRGKGVCLVLKLHLNFGFMTPFDGLKRCKLTSSRSPITQSIGFWKKFLLYLTSGLAFLRSLKLINKTQIDFCSQKWYRGLQRNVFFCAAKNEMDSWYCRLKEESCKLKQTKWHVRTFTDQISYSLGWICLINCDACIGDGWTEANDCKRLVLWQTPFSWIQNAALFMEATNDDPRQTETMAKTLLTKKRHRKVLE